MDFRKTGPNGVSRESELFVLSLERLDEKSIRTITVEVRRSGVRF